MTARPKRRIYFHKLPPKIGAPGKLTRAEWDRLLDVEQMYLSDLADVAIEKPPRRRTRAFVEHQKFRTENAEQVLILCDHIRRLAGRAPSNWEKGRDELIYLRSTEDESEEDYG